jgi:uncharacterized protein (TIGR02646 family)
MIFVDRDVISHPEIFYSNEIDIAKRRLEEFYSRPKESRSQEKYTRPFEPELRDKFLSALREVFNNKCAYCESIIPLEVTKSEYDHFRPKSGARGFEKEFSTDYYWWLTYEWGNLYYSCPNCNQYKSTWFPVEGARAPVNFPYRDTVLLEKALLIDPCYDHPEEHLTYNEQGEVDFLSFRGKTTIEILKLNRSELVAARLEIIKDLFGEWEFLTKLFKKEKVNKKKIKEVHDRWETLFTSHSRKPYLGIQRVMLSRWLDNHPYIQHYLSSKEYENVIIEKQDSIKSNIESSNEKILNEEERKVIDNKIDLESIRHIYVEKVELKNFKCFSQLELSINNNSVVERKGEPWLLFLGENGVGKSSLLKAIVIGLSGKEYIDDLGITGKEILKHGSKEGFIRIHLVGAKEPIEVSFDNDGIQASIRQPIVNLVAYNSIRLKPRIGKMVAEKSIFYGAKAKNLFDYTFSLVDADNWLATLPNKEIFDRAALTLKELMLLDNSDTIEIDGNLAIVKRANNKLYIDELSDGYKSIFYLAVDIMATLAGENVTFDLAEGIVLIDEIGTHLHPRWRMEVVGRLRKAFPKIRFIVTTHEPLCLRGLFAGETFVLTKNQDNEIVILADLPDPSELRVDQILTSDFFGLKSTIDPQTEKLFEEYYDILALDEVDRNEHQKNRLLVLSELVPKIKHLGDNLREELAYYVIDELLARKTRDGGLKITEDLKAEALKRIESLWGTIDNKTDAL